MRNYLIQVAVHLMMITPLLFTAIIAAGFCLEAMKDKNFLNGIPAVVTVVFTIWLMFSIVKVWVGK